MIRFTNDINPHVDTRTYVTYDYSRRYFQNDRTILYRLPKYYLNF